MDELSWERQNRGRQSKKKGEKRGLKKEGREREPLRRKRPSLMSRFANEKEAEGRRFHALTNSAKVVPQELIHTLSFFGLPGHSSSSSSSAFL